MGNNNLENVLLYQGARVFYISKDGGGGEIDITSIVVEINTFEDVWKPFITGSVVVSCSSGVDDRLAFLAQDFVKVTFKDRDGVPVTFQGMIVNIESSEVHRSNRAMILHFTSVESLNHYKTKICTKWKKSKATQIIKDSLRYMGIDSIEVNVSKDPVVDEYIAPNQRPMDIVGYINRTYGVRWVFHQRISSGSPKYVLEERGAGKKTFPVEIWMAKEGSAISPSKTQSLVSCATDWAIVVRNEYIKALDSFEIGSERFVTDPIRRSVFKEEWNLEENKSNAKSNWHPFKIPIYRAEEVSKKHPAYPRTRANSFVSPGHTREPSTEENPNKDVWNKKLEEQESPTERARKTVVRFMIPGDNRLELNNPIRLVLPTVAPRSDVYGGKSSDAIDKFFKGEWTITGIRRKISTREGFVCVVEASRDTVTVDIANNAGNSEKYASLKAAILAFAGRLKEAVLGL